MIARCASTGSPSSVCVELCIKSQVNFVQNESTDICRCDPTARIQIRWIMPFREGLGRQERVYLDRMFDTADLLRQS